MHILSVSQFSVGDLNDLLERASYHRRAFVHSRDKTTPIPQPKNPSRWTYNQMDRRLVPVWVSGKILSNLFYEPSTRTSSSFYSAMTRLGGHVIPINEAGTYSSAVKGESLEDTIRTMGCYSDVIALRHPEVGAADRAAAVSSVPIINAGDGTGEHPTQALLDLLTILMERKWDGSKETISKILDGLTVTMMGDLKHGRTVKSLTKLLERTAVKINWVSPPELNIPAEFLRAKDVQTEDLDDVIADTDVLYVTRVQVERMATTETSYDERTALANSYKVTPEHMAKAKPDMVLMHPLPRVNEIPTELDNDPRSAYFRQMQYGLFMRMAVLEKVLES